MRGIRYGRSAKPVVIFDCSICLFLFTAKMSRIRYGRSAKHGRSAEPVPVVACLTCLFLFTA